MRKDLNDCALQRLTVNYNRTDSDSPARWSISPPFCTFCLYPCIQDHATSFVCLYLSGCEKRQRLGESCRETLQGLERMLIKTSYSTASSFLTVPAAGSTTLCFLTTSSPLSLSALLYFCLPFLSVSFPICVSLASSCSVFHLPFESSIADVLTLCRQFTCVLW